MKSTILLRVLGVPALLLVSSCGKKDESTLLTYIPADTAYVFAATEPPSEAVTNAWLKRVQPLWPIYDTMLARLGNVADEPVTAPADSDDADGTSESPVAAVDISAKTTDAMKETLAKSSRIARELIRDLRGRDTVAKMRETGLAVTGLSAFYGVGMMPVGRIQLSSADAFRAWIAKIEAASATQFSTAKIGDQDYWFVGTDKIEWVLAIQGEQLVVTLFPAKADDALRQRLLGIVKPQESLADSGDLGKLIAAEGYSPVAAGWVDFKRMFALYPADPALVAMAASFGDDPLPALSAECRSDFESMIDKAPRIIAGYSEFSTDHVDTRGRWELAPDVASDLLAILAAPTATGGDQTDALFDIAFNAPVLKMKDFALKQAKAIAAQPYRCESLKALNQAASESVEKLSQVLPPPFSDITGIRMTIDSLTMPPAGATVPDIRGKVLILSNNPSFLVGLAQMAMPALAGIVVKSDGEPVEMPTKDLPAPAGTPIPPLHVAMVDKALGFSFGEGQAETLASYVKSPPGAPGDWMKINFSGDVYTLQGEFMQRIQALLPDDGAADMHPADMAELYQVYASIFKRLDGSMKLSAKGIEFEQNVEMKP